MLFFRIGWFHWFIVVVSRVGGKLGVGMRLVKSLRVNSNFGYSTECGHRENLEGDNWNGIWNNIKLKEGLRDLQVWVKLDQDVTTENEARLFKPLMELDIRNSILEVTWPASECSGALLLGAPFSLVRNNDPFPGKPEFGTEILNGGQL